MYNNTLHIFILLKLSNKYILIMFKYIVNIFHLLY